MGRAVEQSPAGSGPGPHNCRPRCLPGHHHLQMFARQ